MKRFDFNEGLDSGKATPCTQYGDPTTLPWPGFDPRTLSQVPPRVQQTVSVIVREAIDAGLSRHDTYASVAALLIRNNLNVSCDELSGWVGSHALAVT